MARWTRAIRALPFRTGRVLDLGCAFGHATRMLRRRGYHAAGIDASPAYIARARQADPASTYLVADAAHIPFADASFDGVLFLDVMEHLADERSALAEAARVLKPGGTLALSVPHRGALARLDALNVFASVVRLTGRGACPPEIAATGIHRHYSLAQLRALLEPDFTVQRVTRTGIGLAELAHLPVLLLTRWLLRCERLYAVLAYAYYTAYLVEDLLPTGPLGYHIFVVAQRRTAHVEIWGETTRAIASAADGNVR